VCPIFDNETGVNEACTPSGTCVVGGALPSGAYCQIDLESCAETDVCFGLEVNAMCACDACYCRPEGSGLRVCVPSTMAPTPMPTPGPTVAFIGSCSQFCNGIWYCNQPMTNAECQLWKALLEQQLVTTCQDQWSSSLTCGFNTPQATGCCLSTNTSTNTCYGFDSGGSAFDCNTTFTASDVCCSNGACATNASSCAPYVASSPTSSTALVPVEPYYESYSYTLCRVLHSCGDGDEQPCLPGAPQEPAECDELFCCSVSGVPP